MNVPCFLRVSLIPGVNELAQKSQKAFVDSCIILLSITETVLISNVEFDSHLMEERVGVFGSQIHGVLIWCHQYQGLVAIDEREKNISPDVFIIISGLVDPNDPVLEVFEVPEVLDGICPCCSRPGDWTIAWRIIARRIIAWRIIAWRILAWRILLRSPF